VAGVVLPSYSVVKEDLVSDADAEREVDDPVISIGVVARRAGLSVSAVRKYENEGLVIAHRAGSRHRLFSREDINRVRHIQHMIQDLGLNIEGIRRMQALLPCWDLRPCGPACRKSCPGYRDNTRPCWMSNGLSSTSRDIRCRQCRVYRCGSMCTQEIKQLVHNQDDFPNATAAIRALFEHLESPRQQEG
jgi:MerR family transcriptional regulator/heat shock protein HspR